MYVTVKDVKLNLDSKAVTEETNKETHEELEEIRIQGDDYMGVPLATPETMATAGKRDSPEEVEPERDATRRRTCLGLNAVEEEFDISEVFSPARVTMYAKDRNLKAGYSIDVEHVDYITNKKWG